MFFVSFCARENVQVRKGLFWVYMGRALVFAIHSIVYCLTQNATTLMMKICNQITRVFSWNECHDDISDIFWVIVGIYIFIVFFFRLLLARCLWYYYKEKLLMMAGHHFKDY
mmetsp:Transcript_31431/g.39024  ORF Transcript_31431/g.39024 Transcript_31431/m.39024 type:complete len:112 (+) Transcript_31431:190-525(+)